jgi:hypothetical protein
MKCEVIKRVFGKGGKMLELGSIVDRDKADGVFYKAVDTGDKQLKTGDKPKAPSAEELIAEIATCEDGDRLVELSEDKRKTVAEAAQARFDDLFEEGEE